MQRLPTYTSSTKDGISKQLQRKKRKHARMTESLRNYPKNRRHLCPVYRRHLCHSLFERITVGLASCLDVEYGRQRR